MISLILVTAVLSSEKYRFDSVKDKCDIWYFLERHEEKIIQELNYLVSYRIREVDKDTNVQLEAFHHNNKNVNDFVLSIKEKNKGSNILVQVFNKEFQRENKQIMQPILDFKAVAFKAVEEYYMQLLPKILAKHNIRMAHLQNLILDYLIDHRGFGPNCIDYFSPTIMNSEKRRKCEKQFATMQKKFEVDTEKRFQSKILTWLAHRYLRADFETKLNKMAEGLKYAEKPTLCKTPFNQQDEQFIENLGLVLLLDIKESECMKRFGRTVCTELIYFVKSLGQYSVTGTANGVEGNKAHSYMGRVSGFFFVWYQSRQPTFPMPVQKEIKPEIQGIKIEDEKQRCIIV